MYLICNYYNWFQGCRDPLERWYRDHYFAFLGVGLIVVLVEFSVLLSSIVTCTRIYHHNQDIRENARNTEHDIEISSTPTTFKRSSGSDAGAYSNETYALTGNFKQNYKLTERAWYWVKGVFGPYYVYEIQEDPMLWWRFWQNISLLPKNWIIFTLLHYLFYEFLKIKIFPIIISNFQVKNIFVKFNRSNHVLKILK